MRKLPERNKSLTVPMLVVSAFIPRSRACLYSSCRKTDPYTSSLADIDAHSKRQAHMPRDLGTHGLEGALCCFVAGLVFSISIRSGILTRRVSGLAGALVEHCRGSAHGGGFLIEALALVALVAMVVSRIANRRAWPYRSSGSAGGLAC